MKTWFGVILASALSILHSTDVEASVIYNLNETSFGSPGFEGSVIFANFISSDILLNPGDFSVTGGTKHLQHLEFHPNLTTILCTSFGFSACDVVVLDSSIGSFFYEFPTGTLGKSGSTTDVHDFDHTSLELTIFSDTPSVPEASTFALLAAGLIGIGTIRHRRGRV